jgi:hypothetical protein
MGYTIHQQYAANNVTAMNMDHSVIKPRIVSLAQLQRQRQTESGCKKPGRQNNFCCMLSSG